MHRSALRTGLGPALYLLFVTLGGGALAQTAPGDAEVVQTQEAASVPAVAPAPAAETAPTPAPAVIEPVLKQESAAGECVPIGITAQGDSVFPLRCKDFVEQQKVAHRLPAAEEAKPAVVNAVSVDAAGAALVKPLPGDVPKAAMPAKASAKAPPAKTAAPEPRKLTIGLAANLPPGAPGCTHFRSYDAATHSYKGYDGQRHQCR